MVTIGDSKGSHPLACGAGTWHEGRTTLFDHSPCFAGSAVWTAEDTFVMTLRFYETPFVYTATCKFDGDQVTIDADVNVAFGPTHFALAGRAA